MAEQSLAPRDGGAGRWHCLTGEIEEVPIGTGSQRALPPLGGSWGLWPSQASQGQGWKEADQLWCLVKYMHIFFCVCV